MNTRKKHPAFLRCALLALPIALAGPLAASAVGQQPEAAPPAGAPAPQGEGSPQRVMRGNGVIGRIESIAPGEMKVSTPEGATVSVHLSSNTSYRLEQQPAKLEDFKAGMMVFVRGTRSSDGSWDAEAVSSRTGGFRQGGGPEAMRGDFVAGTVKAIDGTKITVQRLDNTTQTFEVDENTSLRHRRESITLADIHTGDTVVARGEMKDGTFLPKSVNVVDPEQLQRMRQFLGAGSAPGGNPPPAAQAPPGQKPPRGFQ